MRGSPIFLAITSFIVALSHTSPSPAQSQGGSEGGQRQLVQAPPGFIESCTRYQWLCRNSTSESLGEKESFSQADVIDLARKINRRVNSEIAETTDSNNYGVADYWALPRNNKGDCEDFVLQKYKLLLDSGISSRKLSVAVVLTRKGENHAVLLLHTRSSDLVLDSLSTKIVPWNQTGYRFLAMQSRNDKARWEFITGQSKDSTVLASR